MQLAIVQNPHIKNPKDLWRNLDHQERQLKGVRTDEMDVVGMEMLKQQLSQNPRFKVK